MPEIQDEACYQVCRQDLFNDGECCTKVFMNRLTHDAAVELARRGNLKHGGRDHETVCPIDGAKVRCTVAYYFEPEPRPMPATGPN